MDLKNAEERCAKFAPLVLPKIGMGTFGSDKYDAETVSNAVYEAIKLGYRLFDCASVYGNENKIGEVFHHAFQEGIAERKNLIVVSKVWNDMHGEGDVIKSCKKTLNDLGLDYLDLYFLHWPFPNFHPKGCTADSRSPDSKPFFKEDFMAAWRQMEQLKKEGLVREIAVSNMTVPKFLEVLPLMEIRPYAHEMELHPTFQQTELYNYTLQEGMKIIGYCPLGSPNRPERDKTPEDFSDTEMEEVRIIATAHGWHPATVCLVWAMQKGHTPIPFASKKQNLLNNLNAVNDLSLTEAELNLLDSAERQNRLVKGHVFLWEGAKDWHDLWDEGGTLESWQKLSNNWIKV